MGTIPTQTSGTEKAMSGKWVELTVSPVEDALADGSALGQSIAPTC